MLFDLLGLELGATLEYWIPQVLSIIGMTVQILSFQFKKNSTYLALQGTGCIFFAFSFLMIDGGLTSALVNTMGVFKCFTFAHYSRKHFNRPMVFIFMGLYTASSVFSAIIAGEFQIMTWLILAAEIVGILAQWTDSARIIRLAMICFISPIWIINCIVYFSIGGILCQVFSMTSIIISIIRYGWKGLDDDGSGKLKKAKETDK